MAGNNVRIFHHDLGQYSETRRDLFERPLHGGLLGVVYLCLDLIAAEAACATMPSNVD